MTYCSHGNNKSRVVGALHNILIKLDDLLDTRNWSSRSIMRVIFAAQLTVLTRECALAGDFIRLSSVLG